MPAFEIPNTFSDFKIGNAPAGFDPSKFRLPTGEPMLNDDSLIIPASRGFTSVWNQGQKVYTYRFDEAMRDSYINARAMRRDGFLRGLFEERILPTINREWVIEIDDDRDPQQRTVRDALKKIVREIPQFTLLKRALLDGVWFGRAGVAGFFNRNPDVENLWCYSYSPSCKDHKWDSVHGDSIQYTFDGIPAIMMDSITAGWYAANGAVWQGEWQSKFGNSTTGFGEYGVTSGGGDLRYTDRGGTALVLHRKYWRDRYAIHQHMREKADYLEGELAGSVQGLGLRGLVYWLYVLRTQALAWMLAYMQSVGMMDMVIFYYPTGDHAARVRAEQNANRMIGKAAFVVPRPVNYNGPMVEQLQMNSAGFKAMHEFLSDYFDRHIERLFVGQSMSSGADHGTGLGGTGRALFAKATKDEIIQYDTTNLDETITRDILTPLKQYNFAWANFPVRFKSMLPDPDAQEKVQSGKVLVSLGIPVKSVEMLQAAKFTTPEDGDEVIIAAGPGGPPILTTMGPNGPLPPQQSPMMASMMPPIGPGGGPMLPPGPMGPPGIPPGSAPPRPLLTQPPIQNGPQIAPVRPYVVPQHQMVTLPAGSHSAIVRHPVRFAEGASGAPPSAGPVMGSPAGSNTYIPSAGTKPSYERRHTPKGGITYRDKPYRSGQFMPGTVMFQHTPPRPKVTADFGSRTPPKPPVEYTEDQPQEQLPWTGHPDAEAVMSSLPKAAHERLKTRLLKFTPVPDVETSTKMWYDGDPNAPHPSKRTPAIAFYDPANGELVAAPGGPNVDARGAIAHEMFHALDQDENRQYFDLSGDPEWLDAWQKEIAGGQLSKYATTDEIEAFSEMGRALHGGQHDRGDIEKRFPQSVAFLRKHGLVDEPKQPTQASRYAEEYDTSHLLLPSAGGWVGKEKSRDLGDGIIHFVDPFGSHRFVAHSEGVPVSAIQVMGTGKSGRVVGAYTHPQYRRMGHASNLIHTARGIFPDLSFDDDRSSAGDGLVQSLTRQPN